MYRTEFFTGNALSFPTLALLATLTLATASPLAAQTSGRAARPLRIAYLSTSATMASVVSDVRSWIPGGRPRRARS